MPSLECTYIASACILLANMQSGGHIYLQRKLGSVVPYLEWPYSQKKFQKREWYWESSACLCLCSMCVLEKCGKSLIVEYCVLIMFIRSSFSLFKSSSFLVYMLLRKCDIFCYDGKLKYFSQQFYQIDLLILRLSDQEHTSM